MQRDRRGAVPISRSVTYVKLSCFSAAATSSSPLSLRSTRRSKFTLCATEETALPTHDRKLMDSRLAP